MVTSDRGRAFSAASAIVRTENLRHSAGSGLVWGVTFTLGRDIVQFGAMLILARLLTPDIYGQAALAQSILLFVAVASFKTLAPYALQARDPRTFDWDTHFTAAVILNLAAFTIANGVAAVLYVWGSTELAMSAFVLAVMSTTFLIEIPSTYRFTWLQAHHDWRRMGMLLLIGAFGAALGSVVLAAAGAGVYALAVSNLLFGVPLLLDFVVSRTPKPRFAPGQFRSYRDGIRFGVNRAASSGLTVGSALAEHALLSGIFGFGTLGIFTRAIGLAQITSGRIGPVATRTLYPVLTRAVAGSERFRHFSAVLYQGVLWTSVPAATFLALEAERLVPLLYGNQWRAVAPLMGAALALLALRGLHMTLNQIMLANLQQASCLRIDLFASVTMFPVIMTAAFFGLPVYLTALAAHAAVVLAVTAMLSVRSGAIDRDVLFHRAAPCLLATGLSAAGHQLVLAMHFERVTAWPTFAVIAAHGVVFASVYVLALRLIAPNAFLSLLRVLPLPQPLEGILSVLTASPRTQA